MGVFALLLAWRHSILDTPPYEDSANWLWMEANFLTETNFDYAALLEQADPALVCGAAKAYVVSLMPGLLALLMKVSPTAATTLLVFHLFSFACGTAALLLVFAALKPCVPWYAGVLICLAILTTPIFSVQVDMLGMDLPMTTCALLATLLVARGRFAAAALASTLSFLMKPTGSLMTMATIVYLCVLGVARRPSGARAWRDWGAGLAANVVALAVQVSLLAWAGTMDIDARLDPSAHTAVARLASVPVWCPDLLIVFLATLVGVTVVGAGALARRICADASSPVYQRLRLLPAEALASQPLAVFCAIALAGQLLAITRVIFIPRYFTLAIPFVYLVVGSVLFSRPKWRPGLVAVFLLLVAFNLANARGTFFPNPETIYGEEFVRFRDRVSPRTSIVLERSHEYLADLRETMRAARFLETHYANRPIFADASIVVDLTHPRLGYVERPLVAYDLVDVPATAARFLAAVRDAQRAASGRDPVFVIGGNAGYHMTLPVPRDDVLFDDTWPTPLLMFAKRWPKGTTSEIDILKWYLQHMCPSGLVPVHARAYVALARQTAQSDTTREICRWLVEQLPNDSPLRLEFVATLLADERYDQAVEQSLEVLRRDPVNIRAFAYLGICRGLAATAGDNKASLRLVAEGRTAEAVAAYREAIHDPHCRPMTHYEAGLVFLLAGDALAARREFQTAAQQYREHADSRSSLAFLTLCQRDFAAAAQQCRLALAAAPDHARTHSLLALIRLNEGRPALAAKHAAAAMRVDPRAIDARARLAYALLLEGALEGAAREFRELLEHNADDADAHVDLAAVLVRQHRLEEARAHLDEALRIVPEATWRKRALQALSRLSNRDQQQARHAPVKAPGGIRD